jgi:hypothetical protein
MDKDELLQEELQYEAREDAKADALDDFLSAHEDDIMDEYMLRPGIQQDFTQYCGEAGLELDDPDSTLVYLDGNEDYEKYMYEQFGEWVDEQRYKYG